MTESPKRTFSVVIGDTSEHIRSALAAVVHDHDGLHLAGSAADGDEVAGLCEEHRPHLAVVDLMSTSTYRHVHDAIRAVSPHTAIAVFTARADRRTQERLLAAGVDAVFHKGTTDELGDAIFSVASAAFPDRSA